MLSKTFWFFKKKQPRVLYMYAFPYSKKWLTVIFVKSLILAQDERWRYALHMQVERFVFEFIL